MVKPGCNVTKYPQLLQAVCLPLTNWFSKIVTMKYIDNTHSDSKWMYAEFTTSHNGILTDYTRQINSDWVFREAEWKLRNLHDNTMRNVFWLNRSSSLLLTSILILGVLWCRGGFSLDWRIIQTTTIHIFWVHNIFYIPNISIEI